MTVTCELTQVEEEGLDHSQSIGTGHILGCMPCCNAA